MVGTKYSPILGAKPSPKVGATNGVVRSLGWMSLAAITFFNVSGGAYGAEGVIRDSQSPVVGLAVMFLFPVVFGYPMGLLTAELSSAFPEDGGYTLWVDAAFGPLFGWLEGYLSWVSGVVDNSLYPILIVEYALQLGGADDNGDLINSEYQWLFKVLVATGFTVINVLGARSGGYSSIVMGAVALSPFVAMCIVGLPTMDFSTWQLLPNEDIQVGRLMGLAFWNYNGFDGASTFAGEVQDPHRSYPKAMRAALALMTIAYILPLFVAAGATTPGWQHMHDGSFTKVSASLPYGGPWLAWWMVLGSAVGNGGMFVAEQFVDSYQLHGMAHQGLVPKVFAKRHSRWDTPWVSILASYVVIICLVHFTFDKILVVDNVLTCMSLVIELAAAAWLRMSHPNIARPYQVPLGTAGFCAMLVIPAAVVLYLIADGLMQSWFAFNVSIGAVVAGFLLYPILNKAKSAGWCEFLSPPKEGLDSLEGFALAESAAPAPAKDKKSPQRPKGSMLKKKSTRDPNAMTETTSLLDKVPK